MGVLPVVLRDLVQGLDDVVIVDLDRQLAPAVEAAGREVDRAHDRALAVGEQHLGVQLEVLQLVHLDADVVEDADAADTLDQLVLLQRVRRARHHVDLHAPRRRPHQALDDDLVLVALVLHEQRVLRAVDELGDAVAPVERAPDQVRVRVGLEVLAVPVGLEARGDLLDLVAMPGGDRVVARLGQVLRLPVERLHEGELVVHHRRLLVRDRELGIGVDHFNARALQLLPRRLVLRLAAAPRRVEDDPHLHAALLGGDHRREQRRVVEQEHLHAQVLLRPRDRVEERLHALVRHDDE